MHFNVPDLQTQLHKRTPSVHRVKRNFDILKWIKPAYGAKAAKKQTSVPETQTTSQAWVRSDQAARLASLGQLRTNSKTGKPFVASKQIWSKF